MRLDLPELDGRVELRGLLGEGGMGEVHRAWDRALERPVAVKLIPGQRPQDAERLLLEARLQARVEHPHVVKVHEVGTLGGRPCIVLQLVEGRTLAALAPSLPLADKVELVRQAAEGVHAAHVQGLVHRDVKPGNVLVHLADDHRTALVSDFGLARAEEPGLTRTGVPPGTPDYMSPEQLAGPGAVDFRSDVYALGATLYAILAGRAPFRPATPGPPGDAAEVPILRRILDEDPEPLARAAPGVPAELAVIAARAMEKEPAARYPSALALAEDLARFQQGRPILARRASWVERAAKWVRRNRTAARALAVAAAALLAAGGFSLWRARRAGVEALEAARLGALAASLEARMRIEHLAPAHDLRPALAEVRAEAERVRPLAEAGSGAASFALGVGLDLAGDLDGAREAFERAVARGFRTPALSERLGLVLGRIYQREAERVGERFLPDARARRIAELRARWLDPALRALAEGERTGSRAPLVAAELKLLEGDYEAARALAREARSADPGRYEALLVEGEAAVAEGKARLEEWPSERVESTLRAAVGPLEEAHRFARSDPRPPELLSRAHALLASAAEKRGASPVDEADRSLAWAERASALAPDAPGPLLAQATALEARGRHARHAGSGAMLSFVERATPLLRRAAELSPMRVEPRARLAYNLYARAFGLRQVGRSPRDPLEEGLRVIGEAARTAPGDVEVAYLSMLLRNEEGAALRAEGKDATAPLRAGVEAAEALLRVEGVNPAQPRTTLALNLSRLGREDFREGRDPRPSIRRSFEAAEEAFRARPGVVAASNNLVMVLGDGSEVLRAIGEDIREPVARALDVARATHRANPGLVFVRTYVGEVLAVEARRRVGAGQDPSDALDEAERLLAPEKPDGRPPDAIARAWLPSLRGGWKAARGRDPSFDLAEAERRFAAALRDDPEDLAALAGLAACRAERSAWLRRSGGDGAAEARRGLEEIDRAIAVDPRDPEHWVVRARLAALAGDAAGARVALARAAAAQPLVRGGLEYREVEALLAR